MASAPGLRWRYTVAGITSTLLYRVLGHRLGIATSLRGVGRMAHGGGDWEHGVCLLREGLALVHELGDVVGIAGGLQDLARALMERGAWDRAARLFAAAEALREATGTAPWPTERAEHARDLARVRTWLGEAAYEVAVIEGRAMTIEQAVDYALDPDG